MEEMHVEETKTVEEPALEKNNEENKKKPVIVQVKDIIFSFRHVYLDNIKDLNKRLKKHVRIESPLINDITIYFCSSPYKDTEIKAKFKFKPGSLGSFICNYSEVFEKDNYLRYPSEIKRQSNGDYGSTKGISIKNQKISKEIRSILSEEFYKNIDARFGDNSFRTIFSTYEVTMCCTDFIICYNCVGDVIYVYAHGPITMSDILNTPVDITAFDNYHKEKIKTLDKMVDSKSHDPYEFNPGDYTITERDKVITLSRLKKNRLSRYI